MSRSRLRKFWIGSILLVAGAELIWVIGVNWALSSALVSDQINRRPEKLQVQWERARTLIPGVIHLQGLSVRGQSRTQQWYVELASGRVHLSLPALARKFLKISSVDGSGIDFRLRKRQLADQPRLKTAEFAPEIPGLAVDEPPLPPQSKHESDTRPWTIVLRDVHLEGAQNLWILAVRMLAQGSIDADMTLELGGGPLTMERVRMNLTSADVSVMGASALEEMQLDVDAHMRSFIPKEAKGLEVLSSLTGSVSLSGRSHFARLVNQMLATIAAVEIGGPSGRLDGTLQIREGVLAPGTRLSFAVDDGWVGVMDWRASGRLSVDSTVEQVEDEISTEVHMTLLGVDLTEHEKTEALLAGADLQLAAEAGELDMSGGVEGLSSSLAAVSLDLVNARVADVTRFPMPAIEGFTLDSGEILVESHAVFSRDAGGQATVAVRGQDIDASFGEASLGGDLLLDLNVETDDVLDRRFEFTGSRLEIDGVRIHDGKKIEEGWYLHLDMKEGWLRLEEPGELVASAELSMKDTRPLIAILGQEKKIFDRLGSLLDFKDVVGETDLEIAAHRMEIENLRIDSEGLELQASLQILDKKLAGILYTKFHGIDLALDLRGEKKRWVLFHPLEWYEEQTVPWQGRSAGRPTAHGRLPSPSSDRGTIASGNQSATTSVD